MTTIAIPSRELPISASDIFISSATSTSSQSPINKKIANPLGLGMPATSSTVCLTNIKPIQRESQVFTLKEKTSHLLQNALSQLKYPYFAGQFSNPEERQNYQEFISVFSQREQEATSIVAEVLAQNEPKILASLQQLKRNKSDLTHIIIKGCPLQPAQQISTPLPYGFTDLSDKNPAPEWLLIGMANMLGKPMGYTNEKNAQIIHQIAPDPEKIKSLSSAGSKADLPPHIEAAALYVRPDFLVIGCARGDRERQAETSIYPVDSAVSHLSHKDVEVLQQERFSHGMPPSFGNYSESEAQESRPAQTVLSRTDSGHFEANIDVAFTVPYEKGNDPEAQEALNHLNESFNSEKLPFKLESGDLLLFSNTRALHGRNGFNCFGDGQDRWLQRIYVASNLESKVNVHEGSAVCGRIFDNGDVKIL